MSLKKSSFKIKLILFVFIYLFAISRNGIDKGLSPSKRHREKLNSVMSELCELLPLPEDVKSGLDRLSILKLTVSFFNTQNLMISKFAT